MLLVHQLTVTSLPVSGVAESVTVKVKLVVPESPSDMETSLIEIDGIEVVQPNAIVNSAAANINSRTLTGALECWKINIINLIVVKTTVDRKITKRASSAARRENTTPDHILVLVREYVKKKPCFQAAGQISLRMLAAEFSVGWQLIQ